MRPASSLHNLFTLAVVLALTTAAGGAAHAAKFKVLLSLGTHKLGSNPMAPVLIDQAGNLYTTAWQGGARQGGTVIELNRKGGGYKATTIFRFELGGGGGSQPNGPLIIDTQGDLYGVANNLAFELMPVAGQKGWSEKVLYQFCSQSACIDGNGPIGGLVYAGASAGAPYDGVSPLYGVTAGGGANNKGTVFQLTTNGQWQETVLYSFCSVGKSKCTDGSEPAAGVILDQAGNLFGTTKFGGGNNVGKSHSGAGVAYELMPTGGDTWQQTVLYRFCSLLNCTDGAVPFAPLVIDSLGDLFGTTGFGGRQCDLSKVAGCGAIFKITPNGKSSVETVLYAFCTEKNCRDGLTPQAGLLVDQNGDLFGTTVFGGGNQVSGFEEGGGTIFKLSGANLNVLHSFCLQPNCADGAESGVNLAMDSSGRLYGTANMGGSSNDGVIFRTTP